MFYLPWLLLLPYKKKKEWMARKQTKKIKSDQHRICQKTNVHYIKHLVKAHHIFIFFCVAFQWCLGFVRDNADNTRNSAICKWRLVLQTQHLFFFLSCEGYNHGFTSFFTCVATDDEGGKSFFTFNTRIATSHANASKDVNLAWKTYR